MTDTLLDLLTWLSILGSALVAGVFFAFSTFVMEALAQAPPGKGIAAMQSINRVVVRSGFMVPFFGTVITSALLALAALTMGAEPRALFWLAGAALYGGGTFLLTIARNVPLNDALAAADPESPEGAVVWKRYLAEWTWWNHVRTAASLAAAAAFIAALD